MKTGIFGVMKNSAPSLRRTATHVFTCWLMIFIPSACSSNGQQQDGRQTVVAAEPLLLESGLKVTEVRKGTGPLPQVGQALTIHYVARRLDGTVVDGNKPPGPPFQFTLGAGHVIPGLEEGVGAMRQGGKSLLKLPPALAYGARGAGSEIPPNSTLHFRVELLEIY